MLLFYFVLYITALRRGFRQLHRQSYTGYLDANIRIRLQASLEVFCSSSLCAKWLGNQIPARRFTARAYFSDWSVNEVNSFEYNPKGIMRRGSFRTWRIYHETGTEQVIRYFPPARAGSRNYHSLHRHSAESRADRSREGCWLLSNHRRHIRPGSSHGT